MLFAAYCTRLRSFLCLSSFRANSPVRTTRANRRASQGGAGGCGDPKPIPEPVPYANFANPQTLNLYTIVHDNPETFADLDGHDDDVPFYWKANAMNLGENPLAYSSNSASGTSSPVAQSTAATTATAGTVTTAVQETTQSQVDEVVKPLIDSAAEKVGPTIAGLSRFLGVLLAVGVELATGAPVNVNEQTMLDKAKGLPPDAVKLKRDQGYRDKDGSIWKKDKLHKDHWDVTDRKGRKIKEVRFDGTQLWPDGPKNK